MTSDRQPDLLPVFTLVMWLACVTVGIGGWWLGYPRTRPPPAQNEPVQAQLVDIKISSVSAPPIPNPSATPQAPPPLTAIAAPLPAVSFTTPTQVLPRLLPAAAPTPVAVTPTTQQLTFGQGEGAQPAPEYPIESELAGQHGTVVVRFTVDRDGNVTNAQAIAPCPWPLLNQSAVRAVRETWQFPPGPVRSYEVSIQFVLKQKQ